MPVVAKMARSRSMFTSLYTESLVGLVLTFVVFMHFGAGYLRQADIDLFVDDGVHQAQRYANSRYERHGLYERLNRFNELTFYDYTLSLLSNWNEEQSLCDRCTIHYSSQGIKVYIDEYDLFLTALPIPNSDKHLVIRQIDDPYVDAIPWYEDREIHFIVALFVTMSVALGLFIYLPVYRVNARLNQLIETQERFGRGELSVRSEPYQMSPVKEVSESFNEMAEDIERRVKQSHVFAHAIPHELRTPLSRIQMACDLARRKDCQNREQLFDNIDDYIEDIADLTSDILQLSKLNNRVGLKEQTEIIAISLKQFCRDRLSMIAGCETRLHLDPDMLFDEVSLPTALAKLVLDNLIKNAERYGNGIVEVSLHEYPTCWTIDVEDNGQGIPEDKREEIFLAFARLDKSRNANDGGFGLGLAIANNAARILNWTISVDQSHLGGARFTTIVPKESKPV